MNVQMTRSLGLSKSTLNHYLSLISRGLDQLSPVGDLILRLWVAYTFWISGLTKIQSWDSTLYLFDEEYSVPLLPSEVAAYLGTGVELAFPVLLAFGLFGRLAAGVLFLFNIIAVMSYPDLGAAGLEQHKVWGIMLLVCLLHGPGPLSLDRFIWLRWLNAARREPIQPRNGRAHR